MTRKTYKGEHRSPKTKVKDDDTRAERKRRAISETEVIEIDNSGRKGRRGSKEVAVLEKPKKKTDILAEKIKGMFFNPLANIDDKLDAIEKGYALTGSSLDMTGARQHTGLLTTDVIMGRGLQPGWYTIFGPEQSCKSTEASTCMIASLKSAVPIIQYWDYEGSTSPEYLENIMEISGIDMPIEEIFGVRDAKTHKWLVKPRVRYYSETIGEKFFDSLARLERILPDKIEMNKEWWYVYDGTKENRAIVGKQYDKNYFSKTGKFRVRAQDGTLQALLILDSYPGMLPEKQDVDDPGSSMAVQARMFSDQLKRVKGRMKSKRIAVVGVNQLRKAPMVMFGCFHGSSKVVMADGSQKAIRDLVREKSSEKVLSFNTRTGTVEAKKIVGWYENGTTDSWLQFKCHGVNTGNGLSQFRCTPNHLLLGADGVMRPAGEYRVGQKLMANSYQPRLSEDQRQLVLSSIIGDGYFLGKLGERLGISHNESQLEYLQWKREVFGDFAGTLYEGKGYTRKNGAVVGMHHLEVKQVKDPWFLEQYMEHRHGIEGFGYRLASLAKKLDLLGVAVWVMDDASKSARGNWFVKTCSLSVLERNAFVKILNRRLDLGLQIGNIGADIGVVVTSKTIIKLVPYLHKQFKDVLSSAYSVVNFQKLGTYKAKAVQQGSYGAPATITSIAHTTSMTGKDTAGKSIHDKVKYDIEVEGNHTYCVNGVFVHNSPEYEPGGEALKFFSDVRLRYTPRVMNAAPGIKGKGMVLEEPGIDGGTDSYRFIHVRAHKNKLSVPYLEGWIRLWITDSHDQARGFDPVWDTWRYLVDTGQCESNVMDKVKLCLDGKTTKGTLKWMEFKTWVLGTSKQRAEVCKKLGAKPFDLRAFCMRQLHERDGLELYFKQKQLSNAKKLTKAEAKALKDGDQAAEGEDED